MNEMRKNHIVQIELKDKRSIDGIVYSYSKDRFSVLIAFDSLEIAKELSELDELCVSVYTHLGIKKIKSHVIETLRKDNCIVLENNEAAPIIQRRQNVRVVSNFDFNIIKDDNCYKCFCINISAGGIAFYCNEVEFELNEKIKIEFLEREFEKNIQTSATIIKVNDSSYVAKYANLNKYDEDKIVKYVFKMIAKK